MLWTLASFAVVLGVLIVVHEWGHFIAARLCNVKVLRFSVGFGKPLWSRHYGADKTEWAVAAFPLGGYVKMLDEREAEVTPEELPRAFNRQSVSRRIFIVAAGPLANLLLAVLIYAFLFVSGVSEPRPILAQPAAGTLAAEANIGAGEMVRSINAEKILSWNQFNWLLLHSLLDADQVQLETIDADSQIRHYRLDSSKLAGRALEQEGAAALGLRLKPFDLPAVLGEVQPDSPAARAGLASGDRVLMLDGEALSGWRALVKNIRASEGQPLQLTVERAGRSLDITLTPEKISSEDSTSYYRIGVGVRDDPAVRERAMVVVRYGLLESMQRAVAQTWDTATLSLQFMGRMVTGDVSLKNISGPVTIADYAGQSARLGSDHFLRFLALVSISIGVLNLLPIPVLDGGHLMYYFAEIIKGGPISEHVMEIGQQLGIGLLVLLMAVALYNDINRLISG